MMLNVSLIRFIIIIAELVLGYVLQNSVLIHFPVSAIVPDVIMIVVASVAYLRGRNAGILYGFLAGLLYDILYGDILGIYAVIYLVCGFLCGFSNRFYRKDNNFLPLLMIGTAEFISMNLYYLIWFLRSQTMNYTSYLNHMILPRMVYTVLIGVIIYKLCQLSLQWTIRLEQQNRIE